MTGWTQATVRFEEERHADALVEDAQASREFRVAESVGNIARLRKVGYHNHEAVVDILQAAGPIELALVADFNDTTDSGEVSIYRPQHRTGWEKTQGGARCPEAMRWDFAVRVDGLVETGERAGNDYSMEEMYADD